MEGGHSFFMASRASAEDVDQFRLRYVQELMLEESTVQPVQAPWYDMGGQTRFAAFLLCTVHLFVRRRRGAT